MYSSEAAVGWVRVPYGRVEWVKIGLGFMAVFLLFLCTYFLCGAMKWDRHSDLHLDDSSNEPSVTVAASPGFLSMSHEISGDGSTVQVVSHSSVPVDAVVKAEEGHDLFTYPELMPSESFTFEYDEPCLVIASAS